MKMWIFWAACLVLAALPVVFIWNSVYKDGIVGRVSLSGISSIAILFLIDPWFGDNQYDVPPLAVALTVAFALFISWHLWRFHNRVLKCADGQCPPEGERRKTPDRRFSTS